MLDDVQMQEVSALTFTFSFNPQPSILHNDQMACFFLWLFRELRCDIGLQARAAGVQVTPCLLAASQHFLWLSHVAVTFHSLCRNPAYPLLIFFHTPLPSWLECPSLLRAVPSLPLVA